jgi:hypothetical protein
VPENGYQQAQAAIILIVIKFNQRAGELTF